MPRHPPPTYGWRFGETRTFKRPDFFFNPDPNVRKAAVRKRQAWSAEYAAAHKRFCDGQRDAVFPYGTYWMHHFMHVRVANAPP